MERILWTNLWTVLASSANVRRRDRLRILDLHREPYLEQLERLFYLLGIHSMCTQRVSQINWLREDMCQVPYLPSIHREAKHPPKISYAQ
jgi:hypothetical protein